MLFLLVKKAKEKLLILSICVPGGGGSIGPFGRGVRGNGGGGRKLPPQRKRLCLLLCVHAGRQLLIKQNSIWPAYLFCSFLILCSFLVRWARIAALLSGIEYNLHHIPRDLEIFAHGTYQHRCCWCAKRATHAECFSIDIVLGWSARASRSAAQAAS